MVAVDERLLTDGAARGTLRMLSCPKRYCHVTYDTTWRAEPSTVVGGMVCGDTYSQKAPNGGE